MQPARKEEAQRAEAAKLLALAQLRIETDPTEALAFTMASLELADTEESRVFVMKTLWAGPPVLALDSDARPKCIRTLSFQPRRPLAIASRRRPQQLCWSGIRTGAAPLSSAGIQHLPRARFRTGLDF